MKRNPLGELAVILRSPEYRQEVITTWLRSLSDAELDEVSAQLALMMQKERERLADEIDG